MYKSRSIAKKIQIPHHAARHSFFGELENYGDSSEITKSKANFYLGDKISSEDISPQSIGSDIFSNCDVSFGKSSSSSVSWAEDNDEERTSLVQQEYERMEMVLQGLEEIPPYYDCDEYELWINTFPSLR